MHHRSLLLAAASALTLVATGAAAQDDDTAAVEEVVVTGTRAEGRTRLDTLAPVDVINAQALGRQGVSTELAQSLAALTPAVNFPRPAISDGSDHVRPATLRGLAPDQTLVLINGVRGHVGALVNVNGALGRGSTAFDLNTIPTVSISAVEVLRDGASAQYGADAIAGVINLRLREARSGGSLSANYGVYETEVKTARGERDANDGVTYSLAGWQGLPLGAEGFLTISAEYVKRNPTNRSDFADPVQLPAYGRPIVLGRFGDPELESWTIYANAGVPLSNGWELYGTAGYQDRESISAATARQYNSSNNVPAIYPGGFLPQIASDIKDYNLIGGLRGEAGGFDLDFSVSYGRNELKYTTQNSLNVTYGAASQTSFYAGDLAYDQFLVGIDAKKAIEVGMASPLNVAFGVEYRHEGFEVGAGEPASYSKGPLNGAPVSQGFPGFRPSNITDEGRHSWGAYIDLEGNLTEAFSVAAAARFEDYSDFGSTLTGKLSARYDFNEAFALRGSVSSGFKAPALQQQYFSYTSTNLVTTVVGGVPTSQLIEAGTFRVTDPVAIALGAKPLDAETSVNFSGGLVFRSGGFELTADAYHISIDDRIVYSESLGVATPSTPPGATAIIQAILAPYGVSAARFFLNGVETTTTGLDIVGRYRLITDTAGRFDFTAAANFNKTEVDKVPALTPQQPQPLFDRGNILQFEEGTPERKLVASVDWSLDNFGATLKATSYDSVLVGNNNAALDYKTGDATLIDIEGRYQLPYGVRIALGVNNLTDKYPNFTPAAINAPTGSVGFPQYSPFGFNGRFLYARVSVDW